MNLILFESSEVTGGTALLDAADPRAVHLRTVLRRKAGDAFDAGVIDGPRGKGTVLGDADGGAATACAPGTGRQGSPQVLPLLVSFAWGEAPPPLDPIHLIVGLPRPQTARRILHESAAMGVSSLVFFPSERGEPSYADSPLWTGGEWRRRLAEGAAQSFGTRLPAMKLAGGLAAALDGAESAANGTAGPNAPHSTAGNSPPTRLALDNYEASRPLASVDLSSRRELQSGPEVSTPASGSHLPAGCLILAIGSERGWSPSERDQLRTHGFELVHLGARVLRCETALVAAVAILKAGLGLLN